MKPLKRSPGGKHLFRDQLDAIIDLRHPVVQLAALLPWADFNESFGTFFYKPVGRPRPCG